MTIFDLSMLFFTEHFDLKVVNLSSLLLVRVLMLLLLLLLL